MDIGTQIDSQINTTSWLAYGAVVIGLLWLAENKHGRIGIFIQAIRIRREGGGGGINVINRYNILGFH